MSVNVKDNTKRYKLIHELGKTFGFKVPIDGALSFIKHSVQINLLELDQKFQDNDPDYSIKGTYKGIETSISGYVRLKFGTKTHDILQQLI